MRRWRKSLKELLERYSNKGKKISFKLLNKIIIYLANEEHWINEIESIDSWSKAALICREDSFFESNINGMILFDGVIIDYKNQIVELRNKMSG